MKLNYTYEETLRLRVSRLEYNLGRDKKYLQRKFIGFKRRERLARKISRTRDQLAAVKVELALIS